MSKADEADDLYADLYGEEPEPTVSAPAPKVEASATTEPVAAVPATSTSASMTTTPAAPAAPLASATAPKPAEMGASFIPGQLAAPPVDSAEARTAAAARGEHVAPQDLPDEGYVFNKPVGECTPDMCLYNGSYVPLVHVCT